MRLTAQYRYCALFLAFAIVIGLNACAGVAPAYQATNDNVRLLQADKNSKLATGEFKNGKKGKELDNLSIRAGAYTSPYEGSFALYLREAIRAELEAAGRWDPNSRVRISGELLDNALEAGASTGSGLVSAHFVVERAGMKSYDKTLTAKHQWESSFMGPVAIPAARQGYAATVQKLVNQLFADKDFQAATKN